MLTKCKACPATIDINVNKDGFCSDKCREHYKERSAEVDAGKKELCANCGEISNFAKTLGSIRILGCLKPGCRSFVNRKYFRLVMLRRRNGYGKGNCGVKDCNFKLTSLKCHGPALKEYRLCPSHHLLLETELETLESLGLEPTS